jgi:hypothetical protein
MVGLARSPARQSSRSAPALRNRRLAVFEDVVNRLRKKGLRSPFPLNGQSLTPRSSNFPAMPNSSKSCAIYSLAKLAYLASRTGGRSSVQLLSLLIVTSTRQPHVTPPSLSHLEASRAVLGVLRRLRVGRLSWLDARKPANSVIYSRNSPMDGRLCRKDGLSMVLSLYLRTTLGIIYFQSLEKFGGAFEEPFLRLENRTRLMRR